ncbi:MAG: helix-turn-helix transcriptional regulator [Dehalococcoidales bacterium]|nr:helix-turn-helix transcriptional regulator [Dehalococcoidales bacterium]
MKYEDFKAELLADPEVRAEYEALEPEFRLIRDILLRRSELNLSQMQLAKLVGTKQPAISRLERGDGNITINRLCRVADALDADLDISLKARPHTKIASSQRSPRR